MGGFWDYTLQFYGREGVQPSVIHLQDARGADVNLLIYAAWAASLGLPALTTERAGELASRVTAWRDRAIEPLRAVRNALRPGVANVPEDDCKALRGQVLKLEIEAERIEQVVLEAATPEAAGRSSDEPDPAAVAANLAAVAALNPAPLGEADRNALRAVLAAACQAADPAAIDAALTQAM